MPHTGQESQWVWGTFWKLKWGQRHRSCWLSAHEWGGVGEMKALLSELPEKPLPHSWGKDGLVSFVLFFPFDLEIVRVRSTEHGETNP